MTSKYNFKFTETDDGLWLPINQHGGGFSIKEEPHLIAGGGPGESPPFYRCTLQPDNTTDSWTILPFTSKKEYLVETASELVHSIGGFVAQWWCEVHWLMVPPTENRAVAILDMRTDATSAVGRGKLGYLRIVENENGVGYRADWVLANHYYVPLCAGVPNPDTARNRAEQWLYDVADTSKWFDSCTKMDEIKGL